MVTQYVTHTTHWSKKRHISDEGSGIYNDGYGTTLNLLPQRDFAAVGIPGTVEIVVRDLFQHLSDFIFSLHSQSHIANSKYGQPIACVDPAGEAIVIERRAQWLRPVRFRAEVAREQIDQVEVRGMGQHAATLGPNFASLPGVDIAASFPVSRHDR